MKRALVTGSSGLIGSEAVAFFDHRGWEVHGVDNNMRARLLRPRGRHDVEPGAPASAPPRASRTTRSTSAIARPCSIWSDDSGPTSSSTAAAQPSHDLAKDRPFDDFDVNAVGTLNLLEATRRALPGVAVHLHEHEQGLRRRAQRAAAGRDSTRAGTTPTPPTCTASPRPAASTSCLHSLFGASKVAADVMVQEYGRYFGMPTVLLPRRLPDRARTTRGVELHGFLNYLAKCVREGRPYRVFGYKGKQVRDNIHSYDVCAAFLAFYERPRVAAVYNLGGGRGNSVSILEAVARFEELIGKKLPLQYIDQNRVGDHICYISDLRRLQADHPGWELTRSLDDILRELAAPPAA